MVSRLVSESMPRPDSAGTPGNNRRWRIRIDCLVARDRLARRRGLAHAGACPAQADRTRGFSLLELVVVIIIIAILLTVAISKLLALRVDAERVAMEQVAGALRSALGIKVAESIIKKDMQAIVALQGSNPMDRLAELPANYVGAFHGPDPASLQDGNWYFDAQERALVYLVQNKGFFSGGAAGPPRARFAIRLVYTDRDANGQYDHGVDSIEGLRLAVLEPYTWTK